MKRMLLFGVALLMALVGTGAVWAYVSKAEARAVSGQSPVTVLMADSLIASGTTGADAEELVSKKQVPQSVVPSGALTDLSSVSKETTNGDIYPGQILLRAQFGSPTAVLGPLSIPTDKVAMSVEMLDKERVAGFVQPGSDVAIYVIKDYDKATALTKLLIRRATVLAIGPTAAKGKANTDKAGKNGQGGPVLTTVLTLAITIQEGGLLAHGATIGRVYFALLSKKSKTTGPVGPVNNDDVYGVYKKATL